jgi:hypothetical protein
MMHKQSLAWVCRRSRQHPSSRSASSVEQEVDYHGWAGDLLSLSHGYLGAVVRRRALRGMRDSDPGTPSGEAVGADSCAVSAHRRSGRTRGFRPAPEICGSPDWSGKCRLRVPCIHENALPWSTVSTTAEPKTRLNSLVARGRFRVEAG